VCVCVSAVCVCVCVCVCSRALACACESTRRESDVLSTPLQILAQKRPAFVPEHMPQFPEPHTYMRTPVYFPPMTDYHEWRRKAAKLAGEQQDALIK
jgi:hypothetical protein